MSQPAVEYQKSVHVPHELRKFEPGDGEGITQQYREDGYVIVRGLLPRERVEAVLLAYRRFLKIPYYVFGAQDTNRYEKKSVNDRGFMENSILNPMHLFGTLGMARAIERAVTAPSIAKALGMLTGKSSHLVFQTMLFDKSTGTRAHQDHYYLDTEPAGQMVAAWYALEDIHPDAGCFFVSPKSHLGPVHERGNESREDHEKFISEIGNWVERDQLELVPCPLQKGDVLFWHPFLIHGAFPNQDDRYSRKSLTTHYIPGGYPTHRGFQKTEPTSSPSFETLARPLWKSVGGYVRRSVLYQVQSRLGDRDPAHDMRTRRK